MRNEFVELRQRWRRRVRRGALALGILFFVWILLSLIIAYRLTHRRQARFAEAVAHVAWGPLEDHRIKTSDGEELGAWFVDGRAGSPSVLVLHGNNGCRQSSLSRAAIFASEGCAVLMISIRAHGDSTGYFHDVGFTARRDVQAAVAFLEARRPAEPVIVMGTSMGAAAAVFAARELGHRVQGYILESPYQDLKTAAWNRTEVYLPPLLSHAAYLGLRVVSPLFVPHLDEISLVKAIGGIPSDVPVLIMAGLDDRLARPVEARAIHDQIAAHGNLVFFAGADHHNLPESAPDLFKQTLVNFCREVAVSARSESHLLESRR